MNTIRENRVLLSFVIITTAICLRAPITSVGSILYCIVEDLKLSNTVAGTITTIPLIVIALLSPFISKISEKTGANQSLLLGMIIMLAGILLRSFGGIVGLILGTGLIGMGITFGNVLIPAIIKSFFPDKIGTMTGIFTTTMSVCSGLGAGISVPLAVNLGWGWRWTFCIWAVTAMVSIVVSLIQLKRMPSDCKKTEQVEGANKLQKPLYKIPLAWWVAVMFGGQSCVFYMMVTWLPTIVSDRGLSPMAAGIVATVFQLAAIPANLAIPMLAGYFKNQSRLAVSVAGMGIIGLVGILFAKSVILLGASTAILALGLGGTFSLSLVMFGMRTSDGIQAARLSGFAQSAGYVMAAIGPFLAGAVYDLSGNWAFPITLAVFIMVLDLIAAGIAGRDQQI
ncbi:CynX/NimT family MFS transporter [Aminipila terrae]|uniref:MFS transporter n=1 Tax=Aminipila terrae TaxID=2697030 RepID=A0A6P1MHH1_9FIRM|nr:MFS transporter [Aminipila terrae]QHI72034.1 MFS transporter [Aminipila terrae]